MGLKSLEAREKASAMDVVDTAGVLDLSAVLL